MKPKSGPAPTEIVAIELVACNGDRVMVPLYRLALAHAELRKAPSAGAIARIQSACGLHYGFSRTALKSARRAAPLCRARHVAMYLVRELTGCSYPEIGRSFANRDHTSVLHGCRKIEKQLKTAAGIALRSDIGLIKAMLAAGEVK